ncbi:MAG: hypothetical protein JNG90_08075 [Planctomycetaceae bacterium]|nr:hypothetical protein [Planctomycetaceae bacterium]
MLRRLAVLIAVGVAALAPSSGCQRMSAPMGLLEETAPHAHLSSQKLRTLVTDYVPVYALQVEASADQILAEATDPAVRRHALLWKSQGIGACFRAAARPDALAALTDVWVLVRQSSDYFARTAGDPPLGPWQPAALETCRRLEEPLRKIHATLGEELHFGEKFVADFATQHPIDSLYFNRASIATDYIESLKLPTPELMDVVGGLNENMADMRKLSALYADFLPKQARWQAELLLIDSLAQQPVGAALSDLSTAAKAAERAAATAERIPALVERERLAAQQIVGTERQAAFQEIERMRVETLGTLRDERVAVLAALRTERELTTAAVEAAAQRSLAAFDERIAARGAQLAEQSERLVGRVYQRAVQWGLIVGVVAVGLTLLRYLRPSSRPAATQLAEPPAPRGPELQTPQRRPPRLVA